VFPSKENCFKVVIRVTAVGTLANEFPPRFRVVSCVRRSAVFAGKIDSHMFFSVRDLRAGRSGVDAGRRPPTCNQFRFSDQ